MFPQNTVQGDFCREALVWRSLANSFILPLLGIYQEQSLLYLVSPFMTNGTLAQWRKNQSPGIEAEIHRLVIAYPLGLRVIELLKSYRC